MTIVCEPDAWAAQVLAAAIGADARTVPSLGKVPALLAEVTGRCPVVIGAGVDLEDALRFTALLAAEHPDARVVLVRRQPDEAETVRATAAGVFAVVDVHAHDQIAHACSRAAQPDAEGQILTVFAAKAGYGKTTLATNLALALRADGARRVCLLDLDLECGDVASVLDLSTTRTLARLIGPRHRRRAAGQRRAGHHLRAHRPGLHPGPGGARRRRADPAGQDRPAAAVPGQPLRRRGGRPAGPLLTHRADRPGQRPPPHPGGHARAPGPEEPAADAGHP